MHPVVFLVVEGKVLDGGADAALLFHTDGVCSCAFTCNKGILGIVLKVSSAKRISVNVHARCQPQGNAKLNHFLTDDGAGLLDGLHIPALRQMGGDGNGGAILIIAGCIGRKGRFLKQIV